MATSIRYAQIRTYTQFCDFKWLMTSAQHFAYELHIFHAYSDRSVNVIIDVKMIEVSCGGFLLFIIYFWLYTFRFHQRRYSLGMKKIVHSIWRNINSIKYKAQHFAFAFRAFISCLSLSDCIICLLIADDMYIARVRAMYVSLMPRYYNPHSCRSIEYSAGILLLFRFRLTFGTIEMRHQ